MLFKSEYNLKVSFYDVDCMNVVWHGNYIKFLEDARCDMFEKLGYTYMDMKNDGYIYPIAKMTTKYIKPAFFNDELKVKCILKEIEPAIIIKYEIFKEKEKIFSAETMQIALSINSKESLYNAPNELKRRLNA